MGLLGILLSYCPTVLWMMQRYKIFSPIPNFSAFFFPFPQNNAFQYDFLLNRPNQTRQGRGFRLLRPHPGALAASTTQHQVVDEAERAVVLHAVAVVR